MRKNFHHYFAYSMNLLSNVISRTAHVAARMTRTAARMMRAVCSSIVSWFVDVSEASVTGVCLAESAVVYLNVFIYGVESAEWFAYVLQRMTRTAARMIRAVWSVICCASKRTLISALSGCQSQECSTKQQKKSSIKGCISVTSRLTLLMIAVMPLIAIKAEAKDHSIDEAKQIVLNLFNLNTREASYVDRFVEHYIAKYASISSVQKFYYPIQNPKLASSNVIQNNLRRHIMEYVKYRRQNTALFSREGDVSLSVGEAQYNEQYQIWNIVVRRSSIFHFDLSKNDGPAFNAFLNYIGKNIDNSYVYAMADMKKLKFHNTNYCNVQFKQSATLLISGISCTEVAKIVA